MVPLPAPFIRCDPNDDGKSDIADIIWSLNEIFRGGPVTGCKLAADCDGDGRASLNDAIHAANYHFTGGPPPPAPFPECARADGVRPEDCALGSTRCP